MTAENAQPMRPPPLVMRLTRMGAAFPTRLSFMRTLLRRLAAEKATVQRGAWAMDADGYGHAVYTVRLGDHTYSLLAFSTALPDWARTDRVIAEAWDSSYVLFDGVPTAADIRRLAKQVPKQEAGRYDKRVLVLSRANKSTRLFQHVTTRLAQGKQPELQKINDTGYLMRTTAVYGNGKFGVADRERIAARRGLANPFQAELLTVYLIRHFTHELVEHIAEQQSPKTATLLTQQSKRRLGIGNSTGLGMAPFLANHPTLIHQWAHAKEAALARVCALPAADPVVAERLQQLYERAAEHIEEWRTDDERQQARIHRLREEWRQLRATLQATAWQRAAFPYKRLLDAAADGSAEYQELLVALLLEPHGALIDDLADTMASDDYPRLQPTMTVATLSALLRDGWAWALALDFTARESLAQFWYVSEDKQEPRLGLRYDEDGAERELPLDVARQIQALAMDVQNAPPAQTVAAFLLTHPAHRNAVRRAQNAHRYPYAEIQDNLIGEACLPIDMLRWKLAFFGATKFDPKSDRWTRITLFQGAPLADEINAADADDWWLPVTEAA